MMAGGRQPRQGEYFKATARANGAGAWAGAHDARLRARAAERARAPFVVFACLFVRASAGRAVTLETFAVIAFAGKLSSILAEGRSTASFAAAVAAVRHSPACLGATAN